jgi:hypothetical protein
VTRFELPAPVPLAGNGLESRPQEPEMTSPYLNRPLLPLAVALPRMLERIEAELARDKLDAAEQERLCRRAELIRSLLTIT